MDLHQQLATQHIGEGLQLQIALRSLRVFVASLHLCVVLVPIAFIFLSLNQRLPLHCKIPHTSGRQLIAPAVDALRIFSASELDGPRRSRKQHGVTACSVLVLDDDCLPANHVGRAMQQKRGGYAAGKPAIDRLVLIVEGVHHHHLRRHRTGDFIHVIIERNVRV